MVKSLALDGGYDIGRKIALYKFFSLVEKDEGKEYRAKLKKENKEAYDDFCEWETHIGNLNNSKE